jgi:predicted transposase YdaD
MSQLHPNLTAWPINQPLQPFELPHQLTGSDSATLLKNDRLICHWEFRTEPDQKIPYHALSYYVTLRRLYPNHQILQTIVYLRETNSDLVFQDSYQDAQLTHRFRVIRIWEENPETLMNLPGLLPYAILGKTNNREQLLRQVAERIDRVSDPQQRSNLTAAAAIFAGLKLNQQLIYQVFRRDIVQGSVIYDQIVRESEARGEARGEIRGERAMMMKMLNRRLKIDGNSKAKSLPVSLSTQLEALSLEQVESLGEALLDFTSIADLKEWLKNLSE